ncbi:MAG: indolepyruvate oxidoreductase subunit beta family protein [Pseudomonadota bacterium]
MNIHRRNPGKAEAPEIIKLAILAVGGQGGGVLMNWIVALAERSGWYAQATSVPGVAQRTGATIYYVEMVPASDRTPILSLMPSAGDVDIVLAAELMEAGRAIDRGFVTPDRTTLIASSHRAYAVIEKAAPGSGVLDPEPILAAAEVAAATFYQADLEKIAAANRSVISASLFGALCAADVLPFPKDAFEATIEASGKGVGPSLAAFRAAAAAISGEEAAPKAAPESPPAARLPVAGAPDPVRPDLSLKGSDRALKQVDALLTDLESLPLSAREMARRGLAKVIDYQDIRYGGEYVARLKDLVGAAPLHEPFAEAGAKYLANAMAYDDVIRVADLKIRASRFGRVEREVGVREGELLTMTEYMHPRGEEICGLMPAPIGRFIENRPKLFRLLDRLVNKGRRVRTDRLRGFLPLYAVASLRPIRRLSLRHAGEKAHMEAWLETAKRVGQEDAALGTEVLACRRLVKGYSDTHARGLSKFDRVLSALPLLEGRRDGADWLRRLKEAALLDEEGTALDGALKTVASLDAPAAPRSKPEEVEAAVLGKAQ